MRKETLPLTLLALALFQGGGLLAQGNGKAAVGGTVVDSSGKPVSGVTVQVTHSLMDSNGEVRTGSAGRFLIDSLTAGGPYVIAARKIGYRPVALYNVTLRAGDTTTIRFTLSKSITELERVQVQGTGKGSALASTAITAEEIEQHPVRSALDVINRDRPTWWRGGLKDCPAPRRIYINGIRRDRVGEPLSYLLYDIHADDIQEMRYADCHADLPIDRQNAIYIVTKPGLSGLR